MSCRKLLVACGKTYIQRLWCVLELFMIFAFADETNEEEMMNRIVLVPIEEEGVDLDYICQSFANFNLDNAHCYNPNEEARLRAVMRGVGEDAFTQRIRSLAKLSRITSASIKPKSKGRRLSAGGLSLLRKVKGSVAQKAKVVHRSLSNAMSIRVRRQQSAVEDVTDIVGSMSMRKGSITNMVQGLGPISIAADLANLALAKDAVKGKKMSSHETNQTVDIATTSNATTDATTDSATDTT